MKKIQTYSAKFIEVNEAIFNVWHASLIQKIQQIIPKQSIDIPISHLGGHILRVKQDDAFSQFKRIGTGLPRGSVSGTVLLSLYNNDIPQQSKCEDTARKLRN